MTAVLLIVGFVLGGFVIGFAAPAASRRLQARRNRILRRGEHKADRNAGIAGDAAQGTLKWTRRAGDRSAEAGRKARHRVEA